MICEYGCEQEATHQLTNGKWCCSEKYTLCKGYRELQSKKLIEAHKNKEKWFNADIKHKAWNKGKTCISHPELADKLSAGGKSFSEKIKIGKIFQYKWTDEQKKNHSIRMTKYYIEHPEKHPNRILSHHRNKWTYPEQVAAKWLDDNNIQFEKNKQINRLFPDFVIGNIIIEIDGEYWHKNRKERDAKRDIELTSLGYTVYRIPAGDNINGHLEAIMKQFKDQDGSYEKFIIENNKIKEEKQKIEELKHICPVCGRYKRSKNAKHCTKCANNISGFTRRKVKHPEKDELIELLKRNSLNEIGKHYNVTGTAIKKWCKNAGIELHLRKYTKKMVDPVGVEPTPSHCKREMLPISL